MGLVVLAQHLEEMGRTENIIEAEFTYGLLEVEVEKLNSVLGVFIRKDLGRKSGSTEFAAL